MFEPETFLPSDLMKDRDNNTKSMLFAGAANKKKPELDPGVVRRNENTIN